MQRTLRTSSKRSASANERRTNSPFITNAPLSVENGEPYNDTLEKNYAPLNDYQTVEDVLLASDQQLAVTANYETQHVVYHPQRRGVAEIRERDRRIATLSSELTMIRSRLKSAVDAKNEAEKAVQKIRNENNAFIREIEGLRVRTASLQSLVERITKEKDDAVVFAEREKSRARAADAAARGAEQRRNLDSISMQTQLRQMQEHPRRFHDELRRMKERLIDQEHYIVDLRRENYRLAQLLKEGHVFAVPTASLPLSKEVALEHSSTLYDSSEKVLNANHSENQKGTQSSLREMARSASSGSSYAAPQRTSTQRYTSSSSLAMVPIRLPHRHRSVTPPNEPSAYRKRVTRRESMSSTLSETLGKQRSASGDGYANPASLERLNTATAPQLQRMGSTANRIKMPSLVSSTQSSAFVSTPSTSASPRALPPGTVRPGESLTLPGSPTSHHTSGSVGTWRPNVSTGRVSRAAPSPFTRTVTSIELESGSVPAAPQQHSSRTVSRSPSIHGNALRTNSTLPVEPASRDRGIPAEIDDIPFICLDSEVAWNGLMGFVRYVGPTQLGDGVWTGVELLTSTSPNVHGSRSSGWSHNPTSERYFTRTYKDQGSIGILCRPWELRTARSASSTANSSRYVTQSSAKASWDHSVGGEYREIDQLLESIEDDWGPLAIRPYFDDDPSKDTGKKNTKGESHLQRSSPPKEQKLEVQTSDLTASLKVVPQQSASTSRRSSRTPHRNVQPPNK